MTPNEQQIVNDIKAKVALLTSEGKAAVAKATELGARFEWVRVALAALASFLIGVWIGAHL